MEESHKVPAPSLGAEQDADLRALEMLAAEGAGAPVAEVGPAPADPVAEAEAMFGFVVATLAGMVPAVDKWYPAERVRRMAETYVPLAEKRGWDTWGWLEKYGLELAFVGALVPPQLLKLAIDAARARFFPAPGADAEPVVPAEVPGAKTVSFGTVAPA